MYVSYEIRGGGGGGGGATQGLESIFLLLFYMNVYGLYIWNVYVYTNI